MISIQKVAVVGASGNFGAPITKALVEAGFDVAIITRMSSTTQHPQGLRVIRTDYTLSAVGRAFVGQHAVVCVVGPGGIKHQKDMIDAAEAAGVYRFIIDDFGWGRDFRGFPEFDSIHASRRLGWDHAKARAEANANFTWSGLTTGNPIDWALKKFPAMGFDLPNRCAMIYDTGTEDFTGTTLHGIGQAVVGVMKHPGQSANRFLKVRSIRTCQKLLLDAFEHGTGQKWHVRSEDTVSLIKSGQQKFRDGNGGWVLELVVAQMFQAGHGRCIVARTREESDADLLGVPEESADEIVAKVLSA